MSLRAGARVVVTYGERSTSVYTGVITELKDDEALVKWDGYSGSKSEWVSCDRVRDATVDSGRPRRSGGAGAGGGSAMAAPTGAAPTAAAAPSGGARKRKASEALDGSSSFSSSSSSSSAAASRRKAPTALLASELALVKYQLEKAPGEAGRGTPALFAEYNRFLDLKASGFHAIPSHAIDAVWHAHILCTREYLAYCERANGGKFLHHVPGAGSDALYAATLSAYEERFGEAPPAAFWTPLPSAAATAAAGKKKASPAASGGGGKKAPPAAKAASKSGGKKAAPTAKAEKLPDTWVCPKVMTQCTELYYCTVTCQELHRKTKPLEKRRRMMRAKIPLRPACGPCG